MIKRTFSTLFFAALLFGTAALAQAPANSGIVVTEASGTVRFRIGEGEPQLLAKGQSIPVGARIVAGADSNVVLTFADGQVVALGPQSRLLIREYTYLPNDPAKSKVLLNVAEGSVMVVMGAIGKRDPSLVQVQVGTKTNPGQTAPARAPGKDAGVIVLGIATMIQAMQPVSLLVGSSGKSVPLAAGQRALVQSDGSVQVGGAQQVDDTAGKSADGKIMLSRMEAVRRLLPPGAQIAFSISTPPSDDPVEGLEASGEGAQPVTGTVPTASTGGAGGGPCGASCN